MYFANGYMHVYMNKQNIVQHNTVERTLKILRCFNCYLFVIILFAFTTIVKEVLLTPDVVVFIKMFLTCVNMGGYIITISDHWYFDLIKWLSLVLQ